MAGAPGAVFQEAVRLFSLPAPDPGCDGSPTNPGDPSGTYTVPSARPSKEW